MIHVFTGIASVMTGGGVKKLISEKDFSLPPLISLKTNMKLISINKLSVL